MCSVGALDLEGAQHSNVGILGRYLLCCRRSVDCGCLRSKKNSIFQGKYED